MLKLLTHPMAFCMFQRGDYVLHASSVSINNKAYLFIGPSTIGKSFLAGSLLNHGKFLTEDIARINLQDKASIYPSLPIIKLSHDFFEFNDLKYDSSFCIKNDLRNRSGYILDKSQTEKKAIEIAACFIVNPSSKNSIKEVEKGYAFRSILFNSFSNIPRNSCYESEKLMHNNLNIFLKKIKVLKFNRANSNYDKFLLDYIDKNLNKYA